MFRIEITSIPEFLAFIIILKEGEINNEQIDRLTRELNLSTDKLEHAEKQSNSEKENSNG